MNRQPKAWLHTALRAQQAKTLDETQRVHAARSEAMAAELQAQASAQALQDFGDAWRRSRDTPSMAGGLDALYQRFHGHLRELALDHAQTRLERTLSLEQGEQQLRQHHALGKALDKTVQRRKAEIARHQLNTERQRTAEAWLLDRINREDDK